MPPKHGKTKGGGTWELIIPDGHVLKRLPDRLEDCPTPAIRAAWRARPTIAKVQMTKPKWSWQTRKEIPLDHSKPLPPQYAIRDLHKRLCGRRYRMGRWAKQTAEQLWAGSHDGCPICETEITRDNMSIDHIVPVAKGGKNTMKNFQLLCKRCNSSKGDR